MRNERRNAGGVQGVDRSTVTEDWWIEETDGIVSADYRSYTDEDGRRWVKVWYRMPRETFSPESLFGGENPPRRNALTDAQHREASYNSDRAMRELQGRHHVAVDYGQKLRAHTADRNAYYYEGAMDAHDAAERGDLYPSTDTVNRETLLAANEKSMLFNRHRSGPGARGMVKENPKKNPPKKDGKWHREMDGGYSLATPDGGIALVYKYAPRSKDGRRAWNSKHVADAYEYETGQKRPRGTKWFTRVYGPGGHAAGPPQWSAHHTITTAKRAGVRGVKR
jgi:hypothetical protein